MCSKVQRSFSSPTKTDSCNSFLKDILNVNSTENLILIPNLFNTTLFLFLKSDSFSVPGSVIRPSIYCIEEGSVEGLRR